MDNLRVGDLVQHEHGHWARVAGPAYKISIPVEPCAGMATLWDPKEIVAHVRVRKVSVPSEKGDFTPLEARPSTSHDK